MNTEPHIINTVVPILLFIAFTIVVLCIAHRRETRRLAKLAQKAYERQRRIEERRRLAQAKKERRRVLAQAKEEQRTREKLEKHMRLKASILPNFHAEHFGQDMQIEPVWGVTEVQSMSERHLKYQVDLGQQTCTCENFKKRSHLPRNHVARWCKHLLYACNQEGVLNTLEGLQADVVEFRFTQCDQMYSLKHSKLPTMILTISDDSLSRGWVNLYARKKRPGENIYSASGEFDWFGWNLYEERWSYGEGPPGASPLRPLLKSANDGDVKNLLDEICLSQI